MIFIGDVLKNLKGLKSGSINCVVTSPPYWGLRDYGVSGQIGLEKTPTDYVEKLAQVFMELRRVLRADGTVWLNLGDSYVGGGRNAGNKKAHPKGYKGLGHLGDTVRPESFGLSAKNLVGVPWRVALRLQELGWYLRSDIIWHKPNVMPESVRDRPTRAHEYIFLLTKSGHYFYDAAAVKEPYTAAMNRWGGEKLQATKESAWDKGVGQSTYRPRNMRPDKRGRNRRSVWTIPTKPYKGAHFAVFPEALVEPCIKAGCPLGGVVLDPFCGSGTTLAVAKRLGREGIGIELNPKYLPLIKKRLADVC